MRHLVDHAACLTPLLLLAMPSLAVTIDWVTVGDPGNAADTRVVSDGTTGSGAVGYVYRISKYEVTNAQHAEFLNAVAGSDPLGLHNSKMERDADQRCIQGTVTDGRTPVAGATVRAQTTELHGVSDVEGRFELCGLSSPVRVTAQASGFYIGGGEEAEPGEPLSIVLERHASHDDPAYVLKSAFGTDEESGNCQACHSAPAGTGFSMPFDQWQEDAHGSSARNERFLTLYAGTDVYGNQSPPRRYGRDREYGRFPLRPDRSEPYFGPGYRIDFPNAAGVCAACHLATAAIHEPHGVDPRQVSGVATEGINCDFCHKVWAVKLDAVTGLPEPNMYGVMSFEYRRPSDGHQWFGGPLDDVAPGDDVFVPLYSDSRYCAPCHAGTFWDTRIYDSFGEWLASPFSDPDTGRSCQDCHMPTGDATRFARSEAGGRERDPEQIRSHRMLGVRDRDFMRDAARLDVSAERGDGVLTVTVAVANHGAGHHLPTGTPLRHLLLLIEASGPDGSPLRQTSGPKIPSWGGMGDPAKGYYAGLPGKAFAKLLEEAWTFVVPAFAYWNPTRVVSDNRIPAGQTDISHYTFALETEDEVTVAAHLIHRREYKELADLKGWRDSDLTMVRRAIVVGSAGNSRVKER